MALVPALLVPIKAFAAAKARLAPVLGASERSDLARRLAAGVVQASGAVEVFVVCDDAEVAGFAESLGARVIWTPGLGLSGAVSKGVATMAASGIETVVVAHADLPLPGRLGAIAGAMAAGAVTLVPDRKRDGTNVISVPATGGFRFAYGPSSFSRHLAEAGRLGLETIVLEEEELSIDIDLPSDLAYLRPAS